MRWLVWPAFLLLGFAAAQGIRPVNGLGEVVNLINQAQHQIVLVAGGLYSPAIATVLHKAAVERGVQVLLLLEAGSINQPSSYGASFSLLAPDRPLYVRVVKAVRLQPRLLLDSKLLISGPLVMGETYSEQQTYVTTRISDLMIEVDRFNQIWQKAPPCKPVVYRLGADIVLRCRF